MALERLPNLTLDELKLKREGIENEELQGRAAFLVLLSATGELVAEANTVIGGG